MAWLIIACLTPPSQIRPCFVKYRDSVAIYSVATLQQLYEMMAATNDSSLEVPNIVTTEVENKHVSLISQAVPFPRTRQPWFNSLLTISTPQSVDPPDSPIFISSQTPLTAASTPKSEARPLWGSNTRAGEQSRSSGSDNKALQGRRWKQSREINGHRDGQAVESRWWEDIGKTTPSVKAALAPVTGPIHSDPTDNRSATKRLLSKLSKTMHAVKRESRLLSGFPSLVNSSMDPKT
ncbi:uncharacterized protein EV420DRAFT_1552103, partial [Desarmillaria tabescens]